MQINKQALSFVTRENRAREKTRKRGAWMKFLHKNVILQKDFFTSKFGGYLLFCSQQPPIKTKTETANRWETTNSKPPEPIIMIDQSEIGNSSEIIFVALFSKRLLGFAVPFNSHSNKVWKKNAGPKLFCWAKPACFDFSFIWTGVFWLCFSFNFILHGHILSTNGVESMGYIFP